MQHNFGIKIFSTITDVLICAVIVSCLGRMGRYWFPCFLMQLGIMFYAVADILILLGEFVFHTDAFDTIVTFVFLLPNYFFCAAVALYFVQKLKGRDLYQFLANTLILTIFGFVAFRKLLLYLGTFQLLERPAIIRLYLYFSINLFIIIMIGHMLFMIASETGLKGTNSLMIGIVGYIILDIPYTYVQALGRDPENIYTNLVYAFCMILMAHGIYHQVRHRHVFRLRTYRYSESTAKRTRILVISAIAVTVALWLAGFIDRNDVFYLVLALLAYWITAESFHNSALNERILKQQDILTGLYNRQFVHAALEDSIKKAQDSGRRFAVICVDLNNFKPVNDTYGHDMGDKVLREFGSRMLALPSVYTSFRTGGDEFLIIKDELKDDIELHDCAIFLQNLFHTPINLDTYNFKLSGSLGISVYPDHAKEPEALLRFADAAMYSVKHSSYKDDFRVFDVTLVEAVERHRSLEEMLKKAEPAADFALYYQPRFDAKDGKLVAVEVFPRLKEDDTYTAAEILPMAEEVGLLNRLGNWIVENAITQLDEWRDEYIPSLAISINLSPLQLIDVDFLDKLKDIAKYKNIDPAEINLDIANDVMMGASITAKGILKDLNKYGFKLALNDFGGGDINLSHILTCGFSAIHISPSLIKKMEDDKKAQTLISTISGIAKNLNITAYAVGIETKEQADRLKEIGIRYMQGFYFGKPCNAKEFENEFLKKEAAD